MGKLNHFITLTTVFRLQNKKSIGYFKTEAIFLRIYKIMSPK